MTQTGPLQLDDADFWSDPERTRRQVAAPLEAARRNVLLFDAPTRVPLETRESLPTQALHVGDSRSFRDRPYERFAVVLATDLDNNITVAAAAVPPIEDETAPLPPIDRSAPVQDAVGNDAYTIDLRERLNLPWEPGRYLARMILLDELTPPRLIELTSARPPDPAVERYQQEAANRTRVPALVPAPGGPLPQQRGAQTPAVPSKTGLQLTAPRVCVLDAGAPCVLRGAFRLPLLRRHLLPPGPPRPGTEEIHAQFAAAARAAGTGAPPALPQAVVPVTLVAVGDVGGGPSVWRLVLPVHDPIDHNGTRPVGTGSFAIDLRELRGFTGVQQTWYLYAFSDEVASGPVVVGLTVSPRTP
ncbi:hypothetical protein [Rubrivivax rivuli]|uniref:Uncharacterized protein n=1 Tax=Rubrivivax rivuli TaxID=1862385 RepID=A0A437RIB1_9BURK|nr:hypothetical protein [Rubrivivax rivuli]RVU46504.1 hypothetical protein EOE66_11840 [Rubrivivax rivuli]